MHGLRYYSTDECFVEDRQNSNKSTNKQTYNLFGIQTEPTKADWNNHAFKTGTVGQTHSDDSEVIDSLTTNVFKHTHAQHSYRLHRNYLLQSGEKLTLSKSALRTYFITCKIYVHTSYFLRNDIAIQTGYVAASLVQHKIKYQIVFRVQIV